ncbi:uncharacterized protein LOC142555081 isoform X2 [Primulina tabacum]|uniref:uncharacterized protein LOC142555081 isoform X2 n=1 Tax=Primulina tabacum TaxID=48773 RepID=UPI003F598D10
MRLFLAKRLSTTLLSAAAAISSNSSAYTCHIRRHQPSVHGFLSDLLSSPWSTTQLRCARFSGADVVKAQHTTQGRGGAIIQVELRDVDSGSKSNERLRTDEPVERVFVQEKSLTYLYTDDETGNVVLMDPETYGQLDVPSHLFGESLAYLQDDMKVTVQLYDEKPMAASMPNRAICTVVEAADIVKGSGPMPYKKVLLDNGRTIQAPAHVLAGEKIIVSTTDNSYIGKA